MTPKKTAKKQPQAKYYVRRTIVSEVQIKQDEDGVYYMEYADGTPYHPELAFDTLGGCTKFLESHTYEHIQNGKETWQFINL